MRTTILLLCLMASNALAQKPADTKPADPPAPAQPPSFSEDELKTLPDDDARAAVKTLLQAHVKEDRSAILRLVPKYGVKRYKRAIGKKNVPKALKQGVAAFTGLVVTDPWHLDYTVEAKTISIYTGSGYGMTPVVQLKMIKKAWAIYQIVKVDYGEP